MSWSNVRLRDITESLSSGGRPKGGATTEGIPSIGAEHLDNIGSFKWNNIKYIPRSYYDSMSSGKIADQDIMIVKDGATTGKTSIITSDFPFKEAAINEHVFQLKLKNSVCYPKYCFYYLKSEAGNNQVMSDFRGTTVGGISKSILDKVFIPLPPLHIQKQIANILDKADSLRKKDEQLLQKYDELAQSIFIDMFGDPVKNEKGWVVKALGECINKIQIGPFGTQLHKSDYIVDGIPLINPMHINNLRITPNYEYSISREKFNELPQYHLKEDDIILARRGEMGRCALVTSLETGFICGTGSLFLTVCKTKLDPLFLVYLLSRKSTQSALENSSSGTTMSNLNKTIIENFKITVPPLSLQQRFKDSMEYTQNSIDVNTKSCKKTNDLFNVMLQKAFIGELIND